MACDPMYARALRALLRDTISPDVVHAGIKYNVIPGDAVVEVDCRVLPGTTEPAMRAELVERLGPELAAACEIELIVFGPRSRRRPRGRCSTCWSRRSATTIPTASRCRSWPRSPPTPSTPTPLGVPTYGFSPLRLDPEERFLERFHGVDERVSVDALRWGLPVLYDVVRALLRLSRRPISRAEVVRVRRRLDDDLLVARRAHVDRARRPVALGVVVGRVVVRRVGLERARGAVVVTMLEAEVQLRDLARSMTDAS